MHTETSSFLSETQQYQRLILRLRFDIFIIKYHIFFPTASAQTENGEHKQLLPFIGKPVNFSTFKG